MALPRETLYRSCLDIIQMLLCLGLWFAFSEPARPLASMLAVPAVIGLLAGSPHHRIWLTRMGILLFTAACYHLLWDRAVDALPLAGWLILRAIFSHRQKKLRDMFPVPAPARAVALAGWLRHLATPRWARSLMLILLLVAGYGLTLPFTHKGVIGAGDAYWYSNTVADFLVQVRAGFFPVWLGQSEYSFFGGVFPLRLAPYLLHLTAAVDFVTGQSLPSFQILNLALTVSLIGGLLSCFLCLLALLPERPCLSAGLAFLYASCPGVLGLAYAQDLYMSFSALPFLPPVFYGIARSFSHNDLSARMLMSGGLAAAWLAHPPIALWTGMLTAVTQVVRLQGNRFDRKSLLLDGAGVGIFAGLAGYSFISVATLGPRIESAITWSSIFYQVKSTFPGNWLPLISDVRLENLQVGYSIAGLLAITGLACSVKSTPLQRTLLLAAGFILVLITPLPLITELAWRSFPQTILTITNHWPTQRLIVVLALCTLFSVALVAKQASWPQWLHRWMRVGLMLLALTWSGYQATLLVLDAEEKGQTLAMSAQGQRLEVMALGKSALGPHPIVPRYFSHGVMDPELEHRLLDPTTGELRSSPVETIEPGFGPGPKAGPRKLLAGELVVAKNSPAPFFQLEPAVTLEPGKRYVLLLDFSRPGDEGIFRIEGAHFLRDYLLPSSGESRAFGSGPENTHALSLWTSRDSLETIRFKFLITGETAPINGLFARYELREINYETFPFKLESLVPYRLRVTSAAPAWVETPRLAVPSYFATVNGLRTPVLQTVDGLAAVPIEAGTQMITLLYQPPNAVLIAYWFGVGAWSIYVFAMIALLWRQQPSQTTSPEEPLYPTAVNRKAGATGQGP